ANREVHAHRAFVSRGVVGLARGATTRAGAGVGMTADRQTDLPLAGEVRGVPGGAAVAGARVGLGDGHADGPLAGQVVRVPGRAATAGAAVSLGDGEADGAFAGQVARVAGGAATAGARVGLDDGDADGALAGQVVRVTGRAAATRVRLDRDRVAARLRRRGVHEGDAGAAEAVRAERAGRHPDFVDHAVIPVGRQRVGRVLGVGGW